MAVRPALSGMSSRSDDRPDDGHGGHRQRDGEDVCRTDDAEVENRKNEYLDRIVNFLATYLP